MMVALESRWTPLLKKDGHGFGISILGQFLGTVTGQKNSSLLGGVDGPLCQEL